MDRPTLAGEIASARQSLLETLSALPEERWDAPSLCEGWTVRAVVGHLLHQFEIYRAPYPRLGLLRARMDINKHLFVEAQRIASNRTNSELLTALRGASYERTIFWRLTPWPEFALTELVVHGQDIRRPLGITDKPPMSQLVLAADTFAGRGRPNPFRRVFMPVLPPVRFEASDYEWSYRDGPVVRGPIEAIVMVLYGRRAALEDLEGDGVEQLAEALMSR
jgi:uncharacterized protein (TIGR03083 family)